MGKILSLGNRRLWLIIKYVKCKGYVKIYISGEWFEKVLWKKIEFGILVLRDLFGY